MSHYSDMGFEICSRDDLNNLIKKIADNKFGKPIIYDQNKTQIKEYSFGDIRYYFMCKKEQKLQIFDLTFSFFNPQINFSVVLAEILKTNKNEFENINVAKDGIPFWFHCPNLRVVCPKKFDIINLSISCFADKVDLLTQEEYNNKVAKDDLKMAEESYISFFDHDPTRAWLSGYITNFEKQINPISKKDFYVVDINSMNLNWRLLIDKKMVDETKLKIGNIACGYFWRTALIEK